MYRSISKAGYEYLRMGNSNMQSLILGKSAAFEGFEGDVFFRSSPHANLKAPESKVIITTKMEFFDQVTLCLGLLERKTNALVAEARPL